MNNRKTAVIVGILFIIGTAAGILSNAVKAPLLADSNYPLNIAANETRWILGTLLVLVMGFPLAMVPVMLYPIFKKHNEVLAIGAIIFRGALEAVCYIAIVMSDFLLFTIIQIYPGTGTPGGDNLQLINSFFTGAGEWIALILAIVFSIGSFMISLVFYQTKRIPRWLSLWGLVGAVLYFIAPFVCMLGAQHLPFSLGSPIGFLIGPLALQEMVFAVWVIIKGFNPDTIPAKSM